MFAPEYVYIYIYIYVCSWLLDDHTILLLDLYHMDYLLSTNFMLAMGNWWKQKTIDYNI